VRKALLILALLLPASGVVVGQHPEPRSARVSMYNGRPVLDIDGRRMYPMFYALTDVPGGRWSWEELPQHNIAQFCRSGVRLYQLDLFFDHVWMPDGSLDLSKAKRQIRGVLDVCPEASVIFRFHVTAPKWWAEQRPDEWVAYADAEYQSEQPFGLPRIIEDDNHPVRRVSMASETWRAEATAKLREFLSAFAGTPEGNALIGMQVANGVYGEWHNWGFFYNEPDVGPAMQRAFVQWLTDTYGTDAALQRAWNDPAATLETATVLDMEARKATHGLFRDPQREQRAIDYYTCMQEIVADNIIHFAATVKENWPRPIITGTFYGYYFSAFGRQATGGHVEMERIISSPAIDYLSGPQAYEPESSAMGDPYRSRSLITSVRLNDKLWLDELDYEVGIPQYRQDGYERRLRDAVALLRRNVSFTHTKGQGLWFYDFGPSGVDLDGRYIKHKGAQGYWDHPVLLEDIAAMHTLFADRMDEPYESGADVLFVFDTRSFYHTATLHHTDPVSNTIIDYSTLNAFRSGVVFDPIHLSDLDKVDLSQYSTVLFGNVFYLSKEQRAFIKEHVARDGRDLVWYYAPGYTDGDELNVDFVRDVTGITITPTSIDGVPRIDVPLSDGYRHTYQLGRNTITPLFAVDDPAAEAVGTYAQTGEVAIARKPFDDHTAWYVALPSEEPTMLTTILRRTRAHAYSDRGDIVYAGSGIVTVHTEAGGRREITLLNGKRVVLDLPLEPATILLDSESGQILLGAPEIEPSPPRSTR
jgi:hypothetical protein